MKGRNTSSLVWLAVGLAVLIGLLVMSVMAPEFLSDANLSLAYKGPGEVPPFGTDDMGRPLTEYVLQGAQVVTLPALVSGVVVAAFATIAGLSRCAGWGWFDSVLQAFTELVGAMPRLVVVLVVALAVPIDYRSLYPIGITWALLAAPGAMDEAAATAHRLGGSRFVEALRAHGFTAFRIYFIHITWMNLRNVIVRQSAEVAMQVVFLEIALSYMALSQYQPSFTHSDSAYSWASLLYFGYTSLLGVPMMHALVLGVALVGIVAFMAQALRASAGAR